MVLEPEPKTFNARSWSRILKFEYRIHSHGTQMAYWPYHCTVTYVIQH